MLTVAAGLLLVVVAAASWLVSDALRARRDLQAVQADLVALQRQVRAGDEAAARATTASLQRHAAGAQRATHGVVWTLAGRLPVVGRDVDALQTVSATIEGLAQHALPALTGAARLLEAGALAPVDGRVDLDPLAQAAPQVVGADQSMQAAVRRLAGIDTGRLRPPVARAVEQVRDGVGGAAVTTSTAARAAQLLPAMLGADGPRSYLVLVQNNAEPRATGGIPGVVLLLHADRGKVEQVDARPGGSLRLESPLPLGDAEEAIFGPLLGTDMRDVTFTPDFPRSGELAKAIWEKKVGGTVDGVVSVDPGTLALVLAATGPVKLPDGSSLTSSNAVARLLHGVYSELPEPSAQDAWFVSAAGAVSDEVLGGTKRPSVLLDRLAQAARQGRLLVWSAHDDEQSRLAGTVLSGELQGADGRPGAAPTRAVVGVYLNDGTAAKMGYYEDLTITGRATTCRPDGSQTVHLDVRLTNTAPADAATTLPPYVLGPSKVVPWGSVKTNVLFYAPLGGRFRAIELDPGPQGMFAQIHDDLAVAVATVVLSPGQSRAFSLDLVTAKGQVGGIEVRSTPLARQGGSSVLGSACGE